jgi:hypothetical protein
MSIKLNLYVLLGFLFLPIFLSANTNYIVKNKHLLSSNYQTIDDVIFIYNGKDYSIFFQKDKISYVFKKFNKEPFPSNFDKNVSAEVYRMDMEFVNNTINTFPIVKQQISIHKKFINQIIGEVEINEAYQELTYQNIYKGIDLKFYFQNNKLRYDFIVHPSGNYTDIQIKYNGANFIDVNKNSLSIKTPLGSLIETIPEIYQYNNLAKHSIQGNYVVNKDIISFNINNYNPSKDLIIDPWSTFIGGNDIEEAYAIATDKQKNTYITGYTGSTNFPTTVGGLDTIKNGLYDAFVTKLDTSGNEIWSTFYGGIGDEYGYKILVDNFDNSYLVGYTNGNDILVSSTGVFQSTSNGSYDCFIVKLSSNGNFIWGTYFGGSGGESALAADIDKSNNIIIGGYTSSIDMPTINSFQNTMAGALDAFVAKFDSTGNLLWSTYCGGSNSEDVHMLKVDHQNNIIISGETYSSNFPTSIGAYQSNNNGSLDVYIVKYDSLGTRIFSTYFGGFNSEDAHGLVIDSLNYIYLAGYSESLDFPIIGTNVYQSAKNGSKDAFIAKFTPMGQPLKSTFFGGSNLDMFNTLEISSTNAIYAAGYTYSNDMPMIGTPYQTTNNGLSDGFYVKFDTTLTPNYSTYIGGNSADFIYDITISETQLLTFGGYTSSTDFPVTQNVMQTNLGGQSDAFVFQTDSIFNISTTVNKLFKNSYINVYPNPIAENLSVDISNFNIAAEYQFYIYNIEGKIINQGTIKQKNIELTTNFITNSGTYLLLITKNKQPYEHLILIKE